MANLPKGALRSVKKSLKAQGAGPQKQKMGDFGSKQVEEKGSRPTRLKSYNIRVNDLVEFRVHSTAPWLVGQVVGINEISHHWSGLTERTYHILGPDGIGLQNVHGMNVRMIVRPED